jgi:hypothetical protein
MKVRGDLPCLVETTILLSTSSSTLEPRAEACHRSESDGTDFRRFELTQSSIFAGIATEGCETRSRQFLGATLNKGGSEGTRGSMGCQPADLVRTSGHRLARVRPTMAAERCEIDAASESAASFQESDSEQDRLILPSELQTEVKEVVEKSLFEAVWVRAEISELRGKNGHLYPTLTEWDDRGDILAQSNEIIWRNRAESIGPKFEQATGEALKQAGSIRPSVNRAIALVAPPDDRRPESERLGLMGGCPLRG